MAAQTLVRNTTTGFTEKLQFTETAGGTEVTFWTPPLQAATLSGVVHVNARYLVSSAAAYASIVCEIAVTDGDGSNASVYGIAAAPALTTYEQPMAIYVAGYDKSISAGQRLRVRFFIDDRDLAMGSGNTVTLYYNGASGQSGDTYLYLPVTLQMAVFDSQPPAMQLFYNPLLVR